MIVGNWELIENSKKNLFIKERQEYSIARLTFSSDEISSGLYLLNRKNIKKKEENLKFAFKVYEHQDEFETPVVFLNVREL